MKQGLAYFFMSFSLLLVLGHSIIPHSHQEEQYSANWICDFSDPSIADILKYTLSRDLGINHLEDYNPCHPSKITFIGHQVDYHDSGTIELYLIALQSTRHDFRLVTVEKKSQNILYNSGLRAPPFWS